MTVVYEGNIGKHEVHYEHKEGNQKYEIVKALNYDLIK